MEKDSVSNSVYRLQSQVKDLEDQKNTEFARHKDRQQQLSEELRTLRAEVRLLEIKLKEKDQELKLADLKIKELRKQIPNSKLKPLNHRRTSVRNALRSHDNALNTKAVSSTDETSNETRNHKKIDKKAPRSVRDRKYT